MKKIDELIKSLNETGRMEDKKDFFISILPKDEAEYFKKNIGGK